VNTARLVRDHKSRALEDGTLKAQNTEDKQKVEELEKQNTMEK